MAGNFVDTLLIGIGLDTSKVAEGAKDVGKQIADGVKDSVAKIPDQVTPALEATASKAKGIFSNLWSQILGPLAGAFTIGNAISSYISNATGAGELADKLKVDIEEIQIWSGAMDRAGGSAQALQGTIEKLNASGKAQGDAIGVLLDLADKAETMSKEAFVAKAKELEVDEKTIEVLAQGRKALDEHLKRQKELGAYTKEDVENSKKFKQSLADLLQVWDSFTSFIGRLAVPAMKWLADVLTDVVVFLRQHTPFVVAARCRRAYGKALPASAGASEAHRRHIPRLYAVVPDHRRHRWHCAGHRRPLRLPKRRKVPVCRVLVHLRDWAGDHAKAPDGMEGA